MLVTKKLNCIQLKEQKGALLTYSLNPQLVHFTVHTCVSVPKMHIAAVLPITVTHVWGMFSLDLLGMSNFQPLGKN